ncbi:Zn-dependent protease (includes SpoIVFB) [Filimonas lacunae]|uniref:Zinc metalloprotease n=1 Tax=Filimonas lacunae TaxID=477680 RepID=A0A173MGW4_9BACT|nr:site-2 protease family protein [Filimonas lacunae]BAV06864.1 hypothetical protein FLA_2884 [Filimonas lacunae]SIS98675.1 Zn-dependent protease (includes SpoIVFB) [Filimonas lacunae]
MRGATKIATIKKVSVYIHWTFLLLPVWIVMVYTQYGASLSELSWAFAFLLAVFVCILLHELGHALVAARFGIHSKSILLLPMGGIASLEKLPDNSRQELAISAAGPLVNLLIAAILLVFVKDKYGFWQTDEQLSIAEKEYFLVNLYVANIWLVVFNLIPAFPLDGGRMLRALLGFKLNYIHATGTVAVISKIIAIGCLIAGVAFFNIPLLALGIFIMYAAGMEEHYLKLKALVKGIKLKEVLMHDYNSLQCNSPIKDAANILMNNHTRYFIVLDNGAPKGTINRMDIITAMAEKKYDLPVGSFMKENLSCLDGEKEVSSVLDKLAGNGERIYPVMENSRFSGVINFTHIIEYLLLNKASSIEYDKIKSLSGLV